MSRRLHVREDLRPDLPSRYEAFVSPEGEILARSVSSSTARIDLGGKSVVRKRYVYSTWAALKAALRNTLIRPSRAAREFRMLSVFRERLGAGAVPEPAAFGECRTLLLLREAFLVTLTVPHSRPLSEVDIEGGVAAAALARFVAKVHRAGLVHGSLFARNILFIPGDGFRIVDLDHAETSAPERLPPLAGRARDLAFLDESLRRGTGYHPLDLAEYARAVEGNVEEIAGAVAGYCEEATDRLDRRKRNRTLRPRSTDLERGP